MLNCDFETLKLFPVSDGEEINIVFCIDKQYAQHLGAAITSVIINNAQENICFHVICDTLDDWNLNKFRELSRRYRRNIDFYFIKTKPFANLKVSHHVSPATYFRLAVPYILPQNIEKVLYLDSDLIVRGSLRKLWECDIKDKPIAGRPYKNQERIDSLDLNSRIYFNAGVMLINLECWRERNISIQALKFLEENPELVLFWDQDALNKVIDGDLSILSEEWNNTIYLNSSQSHLLEDSKIVHFVGSLKPWNKCSDIRKEIYWKYIRQSPWLYAYFKRDRTFEESISERVNKLLLTAARKIRIILKKGG